MPNLSKKTRGRVLSGVRVTRRGNHLRDFFFVGFFVPIFSCQNPSQGRSKEPPRDSKFTKNPTFCKKSRPQGHIFIDVSVDQYFPYFLARFLMRFSSKIDEKTGNYCTAAPFFFDLATLTIVCILQYESHFPCFCFYQVFRKKCFKFQSKTKAQKNIRKCCPWGRKTHPKCIKIQCFSFREHQIAPKN